LLLLLLLLAALLLVATPKNWLKASVVRFTRTFNEPIRRKPRSFSVYSINHLRYSACGSPTSYLRLAIKLAMNFYNGRIHGGSGQIRGYLSSMVILLAATGGKGYYSKIIRITPIKITRDMSEVTAAGVTKNKLIANV